MRQHFIRKQDVEAVLRLMGEPDIRTPMLADRWRRVINTLSSIEEGDIIKVHF